MKTTPRSTRRAAGRLLPVVGVVLASLLVPGPPALAHDGGSGPIRFGEAQDFPSSNVTYNGTASPGAVTHLYRNGRADKYADLVIANIVGGPVLLYGTGDGTFSGRTVLDNSDTDASAVYVADLNSDGVPDIVSGGYTTERLTVMLGRRDGSYRVSGQYALHGVWPSQFQVADLNGDHHLDIATSSYSGGVITILLGNGDGTFRDARPVPGTTLALAMLVTDLDGDGVPDLAVTESIPTLDVTSLLSGATSDVAHGFVKLMHGNGDGTFRTTARLPIGVLSELIRYADIDEDGQGDLVVLNALVGNDASILRGLGGGRFAPERRIHVGGPRSIEALGVRTLDGAEGLQLVDFNRDGHLDMAITQMISSTLVVFEGDGHGHFDYVSQQRVTGFPEDLLAGDFDGDGCRDLAVPGNVPPIGASDPGVARVSILMNHSPGCRGPRRGAPTTPPPPATDLQLSVLSVVLPPPLKAAIAGFVYADEASTRLARAR